MSIKLTPEQTVLYNGFIRNRNVVGLVGRAKKHIPHSEVLTVVDVGLNHPLYLANEAWIAYLIASLEWWRMEPEFRKEERMSAIRGDYGISDSWETPEEEDYKEL